MLVLEDDGCGLPPGSNLQGFGLDRHVRARDRPGRHTDDLLHPWYLGVRQSTAALRLERIADVRLL